MNLAELDTHIARGEDLHTEFKEWPIHRDKLAAALVAFANADGGLLLVGVDDQGATVGVEDADPVDEGAMRVGVHVPRNPVIYKRLADLGLVTRVGSRMIELVKKATGRDLEILIRDFEVTNVIPRPAGPS